MVTQLNLPNLDDEEEDAAADEEDEAEVEMRKLETYLRTDPPRVSSEPTASSYSSTLKLVFFWLLYK